MQDIDGPKRIGAAEYWLFFGLYLMVTVGSVISIFYFAAQSRFAIAIFAGFIVCAVAFLFRFVQMWRCRDIGWPVTLPWLFFGSGFIISIVSWFLGLPYYAMLGISAIVGLLDFAFTIILGFKPSQAWTGPQPYVPIDYSGFKRPDGSAAMAKLNAIGEGRIEQALEEEAQAMAPAVARITGVATVATVATVAPPRPGFGRKGLA